MANLVILCIHNHNLRCFTKHYRGFPSGPVGKNPPANAGTRVGSLVQEDPTCLGATRRVCRNYGAPVPQRPCAKAGGASATSAWRSPSELEKTCTATKTQLSQK